ncbi:MAG: hypothetical protein RR320_06715, partial [Oscillospiraceae bacterium]
DRYNYEDRIAPAVRFLDKQGTLLCEVAIPYDLQSVSVDAGAQVTPSGTEADRSTGGEGPIKPWRIFAFGGLTLSVALLFAVRANNLRRLQRREAERRRAAKKAARQLAEHTRPRRSPNSVKK